MGSPSPETFKLKVGTHSLGVPTGWVAASLPQTTGCERVVTGVP